MHTLSSLFVLRTGPAAHARVASEKYSTAKHFHRTKVVCQTCLQGEQLSVSSVSTFPWEGGRRERRNGCGLYPS